MRIIIDIQGMQTHQSRNRGVGRYVSEIVKEFIKLANNHEVILVANDNYGDTEESLKLKLGEANIVFWKYSNNVQNAQKDRERFILRLRPDIVWMPSLQEGFGEDTVTSVNKTVGSFCTWVSTVHDVIPIIFKEDYLKDSGTRTWYEEKLEQSRKNDYLFTVSEFSRDRIAELLPFDKSKIFIVPPAVNLDVFNANGEDERIITTQYILFVSGYNPHKNVERLIKAYSILHEDIRTKYKLLLVGSHLAHHHYQYVIDNDIQNIEFIEGATNDELINYYRNCSLFVFPSYAEGFGIPPLEAMACGAPTITSNAHSLPEVIGMTEAMFDPFDIKHMSNTISNALTDEVFRKKLLQNGVERTNYFGWKKSAQRALNYFEEIYKERK